MITKIIDKFIGAKKFGKEFIINTYYRIRYFSKRSRINND